MRQLEIFDMDLKLMLFGKLSPYLFIKENILFAKLHDSIRVKQTILKIIVYMFRSYIRLNLANIGIFIW